MTTANKIKQALKGKKLTFVNVEKILNELGYTVILFNTTNGDKEIERYHLERKKNTLKAFTYSKAARIVFIDGSLHSDDRLYLALHELGHIILGHVGDGKLTTRNAILIDIEADNFAHSIIYNEKNASRILFPLVIVLTMLLIASIGTKPVVPVHPASSPVTLFSPEPITAEEPELQPEAEEAVYVTPAGTKFHRAECRYTKGKDVKTLSRNEALQRYSPCKVCEP